LAERSIEKLKGYEGSAVATCHPWENDAQNLQGCKKIEKNSRKEHVRAVPSQGIILAPIVDQTQT
jgi:hypothetical protein